MKKVIIVLLVMILPSLAFGEAGDPKAGKAIYDENCARCHGKTGAGDGSDGANMFPKPRDFTSGIFKFKTSTYNEKLPLDRDLFATVTYGLTGSAMPAWKGSLSIKNRWNVIAYVKQLAGISGEAKEKIKFAGWVPPTTKNLKQGKKLYLSRCAACHGEAGRGDTTMPLEDEWGERIWPRNFSKFYSFRVSNSSMEIFARISTGIPGTPMPSFDDPEMGDDILNTEQKWMVANYVASLEDRSRVFHKKFGKVMDAWFTETLPQDVEDLDPWKFSKPLTFGLVAKTEPGRPPLSSLIDTVTVRALNDGKEIALLIEWDDPTMSVAGDEDASTIIGDEEVFSDAVALYMPKGLTSDNSAKPFFGLGDEKSPVNAWFINSAEAKKRFTFAGSENFGMFADVDPSFLMEAMYDNGRWIVFMKRPIQSSDSNDAKLEQGKFTPIAFSIWDGSNNEKGLTHTFTDWYWLNVLPQGKGGIF